MTRYSHEAFQPHINSIFYIPFENGYIAKLSLRKIEILPEWAYEGKLMQPFSLYFEDFGPHELEQATYFMNHDILGEVDLFIVPLGRSSRNGSIYQAVFN